MSNYQIWKSSLELAHELAQAKVIAVYFAPKMSDTSDTDLAVVDPRNIPSFSSLFSPYSNKFGTDRKYLSMRFVETINLIEMDDFVDTDFLINRVILITSQ